MGFTTSPRLVPPLFVAYQSPYSFISSLNHHHSHLSISTMMDFHPNLQPPRPHIPRSESSLFVRPSPSRSTAPPAPPLLPPHGSYSFPTPSTAATFYAPFGYPESRPAVYGYPTQQQQQQQTPLSTSSSVSSPVPVSQSLVDTNNGYHFPPVNHGSGVKYNQNQNQNQGNQNQRGIVGINKSFNLYGEGR